VRINVISPGLIDTDMGARLVNATSPGHDRRHRDPFAVRESLQAGRHRSTRSLPRGPGGEYITVSG